MRRALGTLAIVVLLLASPVARAQDVNGVMLQAWYWDQPNATPWSQPSEEWWNTLSRLMPQMQVFFVGMPLSILAGFLILVLVVGAMMGTFLDYLQAVLRELAPHF